VKRIHCLVYGLPAQEPCLDKSLIEMIFVRYSFRFRDVVFKLFSVLKTGQATRVGASVEHFVMSSTTRYSLRVKVFSISQIFSTLYIIKFIYDNRKSSHNPYGIYE